MSVKLECGEWNRSAEGFITNWNNQLLVYERQVSSAEYFVDDQKRSMLENTVCLSAELRQVQNNADLEKTRTADRKSSHIQGIP
jgi:hypothetical protein